MSYTPTPPPFQPGPPQWQPQMAPPPQGNNIPPYGSRIQLCQDGKYRWIYEFSMMKNPIIFFLVLKVFAIAFFVLWLFLAILALKGHDGWEAIWNNTKMILILFGVFAVLICLSYTIVAAQNGWKYVVLFEMDDTGLIHRQMKKQVKKAKALGWLTVMAGLAGGSFGAMSAGIVAATHSSLSSDFKSVKNVKPKRRWNTIKVNAPFSNNQVYVEKEDFDWVYQYIVSRCPKLKK